MPSAGPLDDRPTSPAPAARPEDPGARRSRFRPEIEGLRGLAAVLVVIYHVWVGRVSGGVDVFFLLSGFLVVGMLVRSVERGGLRVAATWLRLFWRLLPTAGLVLLVSAVAAATLMSPLRWPQNIAEIVASAFFVENWRLAADAVDYYADNDAASVAQHFWSLSVQGQFYVVAPLLVLLVAVVARRLRADVRRVLLVVLVAVAAASLTYSVITTAVDQPFAYFDSLARAWEFAIGGVLGLTIDRIRLTRRLRVLLGWVGVLALVACGVVLDVGAGFPGYLALWPVAAAAAVVVAGSTGRGGVDRLLASRAGRYLGDISYPLYLWHWPVLILYLSYRERAEVGLVGGLGVVGLSVALAVTSHHLLERPARDVQPGGPPRWRPVALVAATLAPVLFVCLAWRAASDQRAGAYVDLRDPDHPGAVARLPGFVYGGAPGAPLRPSTLAVVDDWVEYQQDCVVPPERPNLELCTYVPAETPDRVITVVGDSHMQQFLPALEPLARERNWEIRTLIRPGCPFSTGSDANIGEVPCLEWNAAAIEHILAEPPDAVLVGATRDVRAGRTEETPLGFVEAWRRLDTGAVPVVALRDNPRFDWWPAECVETHGRGAPECELPRDELYAEPPYASMDVPGNVGFLDLTDHLCTEAVCPPEIGNVMVYLDDNHLSASYARSLAPVVSLLLPAALDR
ncbi:acyltransferase family protein [Actinomycetospora lemnae]|uniref:Acyltransferase family protein n=1 Tax=Actinomycetospora lemnae TaxID=3019891 RepID=A0ABT5SU42_9PSEU|nr:acyltransferase family protein [Actinomycetospora sp. DW7H6]MDD7966373.1 acyltransferase family protein [Actinomycetospora sp. DW7H6]